jgi:hypothetical protein
MTSHNLCCYKEVYVCNCLYNNEIANNVRQKTKTAVGHISIRLPHTSLWPYHGLLPAVRQRFWLLSTGVGRLDFIRVQRRRLHELVIYEVFPTRPDWCVG